LAGLSLSHDTMIIPKFNENIKQNEEFRELFAYLITKLPNKIGGWNDKKAINQSFKSKTTYNLLNKKWINYNHKWVNLLIFDIDDKNLEQTLEIALKFDLEPSFACSTDKGCQLFYSLENKINFDWKKSIKYAKDIKRAFTHFLGADKIASHRLDGVYRNPLLQDYFYFNEGLEYSLDDFKDMLIKFNQIGKSANDKFQTYRKKAKISNNSFDFVDGNRNNYLWYYGMAYTQNKGFSLDSIENILNDFQNSFEIENLEEKEIENIAISIKKYNDENKNNVKMKIFTPDKKNKNYGVMQMPKIKNLSEEDYKKEVKKRQKLGAEYTTNLLKGQKMDGRIEHAKKLNKEKEDKNARRIKNLLSGLFANDYKKPNGKWNITKISEELNLSRPTITKHLKSL